MNRDELVKRYNRLVGASELKLQEAAKSIEDVEASEALRNEAAEMLKQAKAIKAQIALMDEAAGAAGEDLSEAQANADEPPAVKAATIPFEVEDDEEGASATKTEKQKVDTYAQSVNVLRYGDQEPAVKAILSDLYGPSYNDLRALQRQAWTKFLRYGEHRLDAKETSSLKQLVLLPETVAHEVKAGDVDVRYLKATLQEAQNDLGGFLAPEDFRVELIKRLMGIANIRRFARVISTSRDAVEWPRLEGGNDRYTSAVRVTWIDELPSSATVAETNPTFGMIRIPVHTAMARTDVSRNLLEDSAFNVPELLSELFAEAMAVDEDEKFATGTGVGQPYGVLGDRSGAEETPVAGVGSVNSGSAAAFTADGLIDLIYELAAQYRGNAIALANKLSHREIRQLKDGDNRYLWAPGAMGLVDGMSPSLLGYPIFENESLPNGNAANKYPMIFGDWRGYVVVDRVGLGVERVTDSTTVGQNKVAFFARRRVGGGVVEPWRLKVQKMSA